MYVNGHHLLIFKLTGDQTKFAVCVQYVHVYIWSVAQDAGAYSLPVIETRTAGGIKTSIIN